MMTDIDQSSKKLEPNNTLLIAALTGLLTLGGVMSTGITGWITASQSSAITKTQACIARLDAQEKDLREKADQFLSALGNFTAQSGHLNVSLTLYDTRLDDLMRTGYAFSAYAPAELATLSQNMVIELKNGMIAKDDQKIKQSLDSFDATDRKWSLSFQEFLSKIATDRKGC